MKKYGIIIFMLSLLPISMVAQDELYKQDDKVINDVAEKAMKGRVPKDDPRIKDLYKEIIRNAFISYWSCADCQSPLSADSLNRLSEEIKQLKDREKSLEKVLEKNAGVKNNKDSLLLQKIEAFKQRKQNASDAIAQINESIREIDNELTSLAPIVEKIEKSQQMLEDKKREIETMAGDISKLVGKCHERSLLDVQLVEEMESTLKSFDGAKTMMERVDPDLSSKVLGHIQTIKNYLDLSGSLKNSISQMGKKFDKTKNLEFVNTINQLKGNLQLSESQKSDCDRIVAALTNQEEAYSYFKGLLEWVKDFKTIPDESSRKGCLEDLERKLKEEESLRLRFSDYYSNFKYIIYGKEGKGGLLPDMSTKGFSKSDSGLIQYINEKIKQL